ncbi:MAG: hypothetical protein ACREQO_00135 [Candidatus Binatia bacterium]
MKLLQVAIVVKRFCPAMKVDFAGSLSLPESSDRSAALFKSAGGAKRLIDLSGRVMAGFRPPSEFFTGNLGDHIGTCLQQTIRHLRSDHCSTCCFP